MKRKEAIKTIIQEVDHEEVIISSTGLISRELFSFKNSPQNFYMTGSMGLASSIGLGVAINKPMRKVVVIDGDASVLMNLGTLVTIGHFAPENLIHIVLDNEIYDSCSGEPSFSKTADLTKMAKDAGYRKIEKVLNRLRLKLAIKKILIQKKGPFFLLVKISPGGKRNLPRPIKLVKVTEQFKKFLSIN